MLLEHAPRVDREREDDRRADSKGGDREGVDPWEAGRAVDRVEEGLGNAKVDELGSRRGIEGPVGGRELEEEEGG